MRESLRLRLMLEMSEEAEEEGAEREDFGVEARGKIGKGEWREGRPRGGGGAGRREHRGGGYYREQQEYFSYERRDRDRDRDREGRRQEEGGWRKRDQHYKGKRHKGYWPLNIIGKFLILILKWTRSTKGRDIYLGEEAGVGRGEAPLEHESNIKKCQAQVSPKKNTTRSSTSREGFQTTRLTPARTPWPRITTTTRTTAPDPIHPSTMPPEISEWVLWEKIPRSRQTLLTPAETTGANTAMILTLCSQALTAYPRATCRAHLRNRNQIMRKQNPCSFKSTGSRP